MLLHTGRSGLRPSDLCLFKRDLCRGPYYIETVARRRSAALLSGFGLGHVREYAPSALTLSALHLILVQSLSTFESNMREWYFVQHSHIILNSLYMIIRTIVFSNA